MKISQFEEIRFFFLRGNLWHSLPMINIYHQIKTPISFWCKRGLNPRSLIQLSKTLSIELTEIHWRVQNNNLVRKIKWPSFGKRVILKAYLLPLSFYKFFMGHTLLVIFTWVHSFLYLIWYNDAIQNYVMLDLFSRKKKWPSFGKRVISEACFYHSFFTTFSWDILYL